MNCTLCPRSCGALRTPTEGTGRCRMPLTPVVARAALHPWEEPPISGQNGSGTIFFSGCPLGCVFCQNEEISHRDFGKGISTAHLRTLYLSLAEQGAHNINFVNPTHFAHVVVELLETPLPLPVVWNSSGYERVETLRRLEGKVDVYLPDFKYMDTGAAARYSGAADYPAVAAEAILEMVRQTGPCVVEDGLLKRGVLVRHLILPGQLDGAKEVMDWVARTFPTGTVLFSLMSQYTPWGRAEDFPEINRRLRKSELRAAQAYMENLGLDGFIQDEESTGGKYIPSFDLTGV